MSGVYMGKDWSSLEVLFNIYDIDDRIEILYLMKMNEIYNVEAMEAKRKSAERRAKNVKE